MTLPANFRRIRLTLARSKEFPNGSTRHGYEILAPLDTSGKLDPEAWKGHRDACRVQRFWGEAREDAGYLVHKAGGTGGARWLFDYDETQDGDDEAGYRFGDHAFAPGEYVSIRDEDGVMHTFQVAAVERVS